MYHCHKTAWYIYLVIIQHHGIVKPCLIYLYSTTSNKDLFKACKQTQDNSSMHQAAFLKPSKDKRPFLQYTHDPFRKHSQSVY